MTYAYTRREGNRFKRQPPRYKNEAAGFVPNTSYRARGAVDSQYSAHIYPNGECSVGYCAPKKRSAEDTRQDRGEICGSTVENAYRLHTLTTGEVYTDTTDIIEVMSPPPKLGIGAKSSQPSRKYGLKGISGYGRKMLRNAGHCLDVAVRGCRGQLPQMGTLTLPSLEPARMEKICTHWGDIVRRFFQECRRHYARQGLSFHYASCTEIQPRRWEERGEVGLHLHFLFISVQVGKGKWSMGDQWVRDVWRRTICTYVGEQSVPLQLNYRREPVRKSSAAYLAKYASKGTEFIQEVADVCGSQCLPSQWWSMSASLRKCIKLTTQTSRSSQAELLLHICKHEMMEYVKYVRIATIPGEMRNHLTGAMEPYDRVIGYGAMLTAEGKKLFHPPGLGRRIKILLPCTLDKAVRN